MRRFLAFVMIALLCGCAPADYETVCDVLPTVDPADAPYEIRIEPPPEAVAETMEQTLRVYIAPNGDYSVTTRVLVTDGLDAAVYALAGPGQSPRRIELADGRECRLVWCVGTGQGSEICRALLRLDGDFCYCLCLRMRAGLGVRCVGRINDLFSSFTLVPKESEDIPQARSPGRPDSAPHTIRCRS